MNKLIHYAKNSCLKPVLGYHWIRCKSKEYPRIGSSTKSNVNCKDCLKLERNKKESLKYWK